MGVISNLMFAVGFKVTSKDLTKADKEVNKLKGNASGLSDNIDKAKRSTMGLTSAFAGLSSSGRVFGGLRTSALGLVAALGGTAAAVGIFSKSIGGAMQMEQTQMQIEALAGDAEKGKKIFDMVNDMGLKSVFSEKDFLNAGKAFLPITKDVGELNKMLGVTERLASANPLEGMEGAAFSIKELASGDIASIAERFNIGKADLRNAGFDSAKGYKNNIAALDKVLTQYGFTQEYINKVNQSGAAQWDMMKSNISSAVAKSGKAALELLKGPLEEINKWMGAGGLAKISGVLSKGLAGTVNFAITAGKAIGDFITKSKPGFIEFGNIAKSIFDGIVAVGKDFWDTIKPVAELVGGALLTAFQTLAPDVKAIGSSFIEVGKEVVKWEGFAPLVYGIAAAFGAYKLVVLATTIQTKALSVATKIYTGFQAALNLVMSMNPIGLVIAAIIGLGVALVLAYKKSETFRDIVNGVWQGLKIGFTATMNFFTETIPAVFNSIVDFFKNWGPTILILLSGPIGWAVALIVKYWDEIKGFTLSTFSAIGGFITDTWNNITGFLSGINLFEIGKNIIQGMIDGIKNMASAVWDTVKGIAEGVTSSIKTALAIKSPSRVMMEVGYFTGEGLAQGISGSAKNVSAVSSNLANATLDGYSQGSGAYTPASSPATVTNSRNSNSTTNVFEINVNVSGGSGGNLGADIAAQVKRAVQEIIESSMRREGLPEGVN